MSGCDYGILTGNLFPEPRSTDEAALTEPEPGWTSGPTDRPPDTTARARFRDALSIAYTSWGDRRNVSWTTSCSQHWWHWHCSQHWRIIYNWLYVRPVERILILRLNEKLLSDLHYFPNILIVLNSKPYLRSLVSKSDVKFFLFQKYLFLICNTVRSINCKFDVNQTVRTALIYYF